MILSPIEQSIKQKIEAVGTPFKDWDINIYRGVMTGYNDAFIIDTEKREAILANCQTEEERKRTAELIRPILRGRDIRRYEYKWAESHGPISINVHYTWYKSRKLTSSHFKIEDWSNWQKAHLDLSLGKNSSQKTHRQVVCHITFIDSISYMGGF